MEQKTIKVYYYMFGYNPKTGVPIIRLQSRMEVLNDNNRDNIKFWEVKFDENGRQIGLLDEIKNKQHQESIKLLHQLYKDAANKGISDINHLDKDLVAKIPKNKMVKSKENLEKIERIKHVVKTGKVMEGKTPTSNGHGRGSKILKRMGFVK